MAISTVELESRNGTGSESSVSEDLARHRKLLFFATKKYRRARHDLADDILAVARAALADALRNYRADSGIALSTYLSHQVDWAVYRFLSKFTRRDASTDSLNEPQGECDDEGFTLADVADHQAAARSQSEFADDERRLKKIDDLRKAIRTAKLSLVERLVLRELLEHGDPGEAAAELGISRQRISRVMSHLVPKLRRRLESQRFRHPPGE